MSKGMQHWLLHMRKNDDLHALDTCAGSAVAHLTTKKPGWAVFQSGLPRVVAT